MGTITLDAPFSMTDIKANPELFADINVKGPAWQRLAAWLSASAAPHGITTNIVFPILDQDEPVAFTATYPNRDSLFKFILAVETETNATAFSEEEINDFLDEEGVV